jgi:hypothetical protein
MSTPNELDGRKAFVCAAYILASADILVNRMLIKVNLCTKIAHFRRFRFPKQF